MNTQQYFVLVAFAFLTASAVAQLTAETTKPVATFGGHATEVVALAFNADGTQVVSLSANDLWVWRADTGKEIASQAISSSRPGVEPAFAIGPAGPDGPTLAFAKWREHAELKRLVVHAVVLTAPSGKELLAFDIHNDEDKRLHPKIRTLAFSPGGKRLVAAGSVPTVGGGHGLPGGVVNIWETATGKKAVSFDLYQ